MSHLRTVKEVKSNNCIIVTRLKYCGFVSQEKRDSYAQLSADMQNAPIYKARCSKFSRVALSRHPSATTKGFATSTNFPQTCRSWLTCGTLRTVAQKRCSTSMSRRLVNATRSSTKNHHGVKVHVKLQSTSNELILAAKTDLAKGVHAENNMKDTG